MHLEVNFQGVQSKGILVLLSAQRTNNCLPNAMKNHNGTILANIMTADQSHWILHDLFVHRALYAVTKSLHLRLYDLIGIDLNSKNFNFKMAGLD